MSNERLFNEIEELCNYDLKEMENTLNELSDMLEQRQADEEEKKEQKFYIEICREMGIVGMTIGYEDNIDFDRVCNIIEQGIDKKDIIFKVEPKGDYGIIKIEDRIDYTEFVDEFGY